MIRGRPCLGNRSGFQYLVATEISAKLLIGEINRAVACLDDCNQALEATKLRLADRGWSSAFPPSAWSERRSDWLRGSGHTAKEVEDLVKGTLCVRSLEALLGVLSSALLQIARQGMSLVHGTLEDAPTGRRIGTQSLAHLVWLARNQAMHFEEVRSHPRVRACFASLARDFGQQFSLENRPQTNLAWEIIKLLD